MTLNKFLGFMALAMFCQAASAEALNPVGVSGQIYGYGLSPEGLTLQVASGGCLGKDAFEALSLESLPPQLSLTQRTTDDCEAYLPYGTKLTWSFQELGLAPGDTLSLTVNSTVNFNIPGDNFRPEVNGVSLRTSVLGYFVGDEGLSLQVGSGGCMSASNFETLVAETFPLQISIRELRPDMCEAYLPYGEDVLFAYSALGLRAGDAMKVTPRAPTVFRIPQNH